MRLADDDIQVRVGAATAYLRPSLRAAFRLERRYGFAKLLAAIQDGNLTIMADVIRETADDGQASPGMLDALGDLPLRDGIGGLRGPVLQVVLGLAGADEKEAKPATGTPVSFEEYHARLFRIATGWLGWPPETAWKATPSEIIAAYEGRSELLQAIFGGKSEEEIPTGPDQSQLDREGLSELRAMF
jgi:hypothetical protein